MKRLASSGVLLLIGGCLAGCASSRANWAADRVAYTGKPGLLIKFDVGGFSLYIGPEGELSLQGTAEGAASTEEQIETVTTDGQ